MRDILFSVGCFAAVLRADIYRKVQKFSFSNIDKFSTAGLITRLTTDVTNLQMAYMMIIRVAGRAPLMMIFAMTMAIKMGGKLALVYVVPVPLLLSALITIIRKAMPLFKKVFKKYDNLIVTQTFSKSRSMAGARLGFGCANRELIRDMNTVKYSTNPYNVNAVTQAMGIGTLESEDYTRENCQTVIENREYTIAELRRMGFTVTDSKTNFIFAAHPDVDGETVYRELRARGILVRHFTKPEIANYNRITVGTRQQMEALLYALRELI
mgnify:CR=1 FL=1